MGHWKALVPSVRIGNGAIVARGGRRARATRGPHASARRDGRSEEDAHQIALGALNGGVVFELSKRPRARRGGGYFPRPPVSGASLVATAVVTAVAVLSLGARIEPHALFSLVTQLSLRRCRSKITTVALLHRRLSAIGTTRGLSDSAGGFASAFNRSIPPRMGHSASTHQWRRREFVHGIWATAGMSTRSRGPAMLCGRLRRRTMCVAADRMAPWR